MPDARCTRGLVCNVHKKCAQTERYPLTRIASQSDLSPQAGRGDLNASTGPVQSYYVLSPTHNPPKHPPHLGLGFPHPRLQ